MSKHPGVKRTLELLDGLKAAVRDFAAGEEKLDYEFRVKLGREHQRREEADAEEAQRQAADTTAAEATFQAAKEIVESKYARRKAKINRARTPASEIRLTARLSFMPSGLCMNCSKASANSPRQSEK